MHLLQTFDESTSRNRQGIANLQSRQPAHELPGTALADSKDALDGVAVKVIAFQDVEFGQNGANSWEPGGTLANCTPSRGPCLRGRHDEPPTVLTFEDRSIAMQ